MYLFFDTETGGLTPDYSLLTASFIAVDENFDIVPVPEMPAGLYLQIKHDNYALTSGALQVNKIDIVEHDKHALPLADAQRDLHLYIQDVLSVTGRRALVPAGHNVEFDKRFVLQYLLSPEDWEKYFTYPVLDTAIVARFLAAAKLHDRGFSLGRLLKKFVPAFDSGHDLHNAEIDTLATIMLAKKFATMCRAPA